MLLRSSFAAKDCGDASARGGRNEDLEKLYQKRPIWGPRRSETAADSLAWWSPEQVGQAGADPTELGRRPAPNKGIERCESKMEP